MQNLEELRAQLDEIDERILRDFEKRMDISGDIARYKKEKGLNVLDSEREEKKLGELTAGISDAELNGQVRELFSTIMRLSREKQERLLKETYSKRN